LEGLSDASLLGKLLVLSANVRLDFKVIASTNTLAYLASLSAMKETSFITLIPGLFCCDITDEENKLLWHWTGADVIKLSPSKPKQVNCLLFLGSGQIEQCRGC
jgi:hypothetical protein